MRLPCQETFATGNSRLQVWCVEAGTWEPRHVLPCAHAELLLRQLMQQPRGADGLRRLLLLAWPVLRAPTLAPVHLEALLRRLLRARQLRVQWVVARAAVLEQPQALPAAQLMPRVVEPKDQQDQSIRLSMYTTVLVLRVGIDQNRCALPVELSSLQENGQAQALVHPGPRGFVDVPDALDNGRACWQLQQLHEAAVQGTLETWGVPAGDGVNPAGAL